MEPRLLGIRETAEYLGIRPQTIRNRLSSGTFPIPVIKVLGRIKFDRRDIDRFIDRMRSTCESRLTTPKGNGILGFQNTEKEVVSQSPILSVPSAAKGGN
jgi:predicted DNA-binding transcriptional regulator AlpA